MNQSYYYEMTKCRLELAETMWVIFGFAASLFLYSLTSPTNINNPGFLFFFPLYGETTLQSIYTTGTWIWLYFIFYKMENIANNVFNQRWYDFICGGSLWLYLTHYLWLVLVNRALVLPFQMSFVPNTIINFIGTEILSNITFLLLDKLYSNFNKL